MSTSRATSQEIGDGGVGRRRPPGRNSPLSLQRDHNDDLSNVRIGLIGLGYVGLPLAVEFGKHY